MRCAQCNSPFRLAIWIIQCGECKEQYCTKCMRRANGIYYCHKCTVLIMRPPDINELMKLKAKDLQEYLTRHNIPTFGYVEKRELVDLLCNKNVPVKNTKTSTVLNKILSNIESVFLNERSDNGSTATSPTSPTSQTPPPRPPRPQVSGMFSSTSTGNLNTDSNGRTWTFTASSQSTTSVLPGEGQDAPLSPSAPTTSVLPGEGQDPVSPSAPPRPPNVIPNINTEWVSSSSFSGSGSGTGNNGGGAGSGGTLNYGFRSEFSATSTSTPESSPAPSPLPRRIPKLSDYEAVDDLNGISTKELKMLLTYNRVDYKGCVEKSELLEKAKILWKDHRQKRAVMDKKTAKDGSSVIRQCRVIYSYEQNYEDELNLNVGDIIDILKEDDGSGWSTGKLNGKQGVFPSDFTKAIKIVPNKTNISSKENTTESVILRNHKDTTRRSQCRVMFNYEQSYEDELNLNVGDIIDILKEDDGTGWLTGTLNGKQGLFPSNFVEKIAQYETRINGRENSTGLASNNTTLSVHHSKPTKILCEVKFAYKALNEDELTINEGDLVTVLGQDGQDPGWWKGELNGVRGVFPENFVTLLPDDEGTKEGNNKEINPSAHSVDCFTSSHLASQLGLLNVASDKEPDSKSADFCSPLAPELPQNLEDLCKLCMDAPLDCVLLECGHIATCINCGKQLAECPICRQYVTRIVRTFKA